MRFVQVWFVCSVKGCNSKTEMLVQALLGNQNGIEYLVPSATELPEGWRHRNETAPKTRYWTLCSAHRDHDLAEGTNMNDIDDPTAACESRPCELPQGHAGVHKIGLPAGAR